MDEAIKAIEGALNSWTIPIHKQFFKSTHRQFIISYEELVSPFQGNDWEGARFSSSFMVSFDVISFFNKVSTEEALNILCDKLEKETNPKEFND